jgi:hypothetical protein
MCTITQAHIARSPHRVTEQVEHCDADGAAEGDIGVCERVHQHLVPPAHPAKKKRSGQQHHSRKNSGKSESQQKCVER